ncbi:ras family-domain-containing protein [Tribonema minus]|uniref:Ras family-domain-containing protein n=1 Tax=Tribonema minus TaxID=303371 RepID=A0A836CB79_9STRA|nr:ras family-domain-containing protein [Tribonema minus]
MSTSLNPARRGTGPSTPLSSPTPATRSPSLEDDCHQPMKVILLGSSGVGKSNLIARYHSDSFSTEFMSTIGVEFVTKKIEVDGQAVWLQIWDTAGQERYAAMMKTYYRRAKGAVLVYDVTDATSFEALELWRAALGTNAAPDCVAVVAGNKCDMEPAVSAQQAQAYAQGADMAFKLTSAKTAENVRELFEELARRMVAARAAAAATAAPSTSAAAAVRLKALPTAAQRARSYANCC